MYTNPLTRQKEIYLPGFAGKKPLIPTQFSTLESKAKEKMSAEAYAYIAGGASEQDTMAHNRTGFQKVQIVPRMLRNVESRDIGIELWGEKYPTPLLTAPIGVLELVHKHADIAVAKAAAELGIPMIFSNQASYDMESCSREMGSKPRWFQLYWSKSDELVKSLVNRAEACGCSALVVTLDTPLLGWRPRDLDLAYLPFSRAMGIAQYSSDPVFQEIISDPSRRKGLEDSGGFSFTKLRNIIRMFRNYKGPGNLRDHLKSKAPIFAVRTFTDLYSRPSISWNDLSFLRNLTDLPILLKGILHPDDAKKALEAGMDGIIVSNHGGRQVGGSISSIQALPKVVDAIGDNIPVLLDSGVRSGADVFKAIALGATAVCIGRPYVYGLTLGGSEGVKTVLKNVLAEFELTMALSGCKKIEEIDRGAVITN